MGFFDAERVGDRRDRPRPVTREHGHANALRAQGGDGGGGILLRRIGQVDAPQVAPSAATWTRVSGPRVPRARSRRTGAGRRPSPRAPRAVQPRSHAAARSAVEPVTPQ
jgi:hypothetical protein